MRADAPRERRGDAAMLEIERCVADLRLCVIDGALRAALVGRSPIYGLFRSERLRRQHLGTSELAVGECKPRVSGLELSIGLCQPDLVGSRVDGKEKVAFVDDISILEIDAGQRAADLGTELNLLDRGKLTKEAQPRIDLARQRLAHLDLRNGRGMRRRRRVTRMNEPCSKRGDGKRRNCAREKGAFVHISARHLCSPANGPPMLFTTCMFNSFHGPGGIMSSIVEPMLGVRARYDVGAVAAALT